MSLEFKHEIISESMGSVPAMTNIYFLVLAVGKFFSQETIVLDIVDDFEET